MTPAIEILTEKKLIGKRLNMSLANNKTVDLWRSFMPRRHEINNKVNNDFISMQVYDHPFDPLNFNALTTYDKWATVEVNDFGTIPDDMKTFTLQGGLYAVFIHKGLATDGERTLRYIYETWMPDSDYESDNRPQFEVMGEKYKNNNPESEEEIRIPIKLKT